MLSYLLTALKNPGIVTGISDVKDENKL